MYQFTIYSNKCVKAVQLKQRYEPWSVGKFDPQFAHGTNDGKQTLDSVGVDN